MKNALRLLCISTVVSVGGFAGVQPLAVTLMEKQGEGPARIGLISALIFGGILVLAPFQPALALRFGAMRTYQTGKAFAVLGFTGCALATSPWSWCAAYLLLGFAAALTWPLTDSLIATEAPAQEKGAWLSQFQAAMGVAFALGPILAALLAQWPRGICLGAAALAGLSSLPLIGKVLPTPKEEDEDDSTPLLVWRSSAGLAIIAFLGGLFENGTHTAGTLVALARGWSGPSAIALAGVMAAGSFAVQRPLGLAADRQGTRGVLLWSLAVLAASLYVLPLIAWWPWLLWGLALIWGGASGCLYTLSMTGTAQDCPQRQVVAATTLMVLAYTLGSAAGPIIAGVAVDTAPLAGVAILFGLLATLGLIFAFRRKTRALDAGKPGA